MRIDGADSEFPNPALAAKVCGMKLRWIAAVMLLVLAAWPALAQSPDDRYVTAYNLIQEADRLADSGQARVAVTKYLEAQVAVKELQAQYPNWNGDYGSRWIDGIVQYWNSIRNGIGLSVYHFMTRATELNWGAVLHSCTIC